MYTFEARTCDGGSSSDNRHPSDRERLSHSHHTIDDDRSDERQLTSDSLVGQPSDKQRGHSLESPSVSAPFGASLSTCQESLIICSARLSLSGSEASGGCQMRRLAQSSEPAQVRARTQDLNPKPVPSLEVHRRAAAADSESESESKSGPEPESEWPSRMDKHYYANRAH